MAHGPHIALAPLRLHAAGRRSARGADHDDVVASVDKALRLDAKVGVDLADLAQGTAATARAGLDRVGRVDLLDLRVDQMVSRLVASPQFIDAADQLDVLLGHQHR